MKPGSDPETSDIPLPQGLGTPPETPDTLASMTEGQAHALGIQPPGAINQDPPDLVLPRVGVEAVFHRRDFGVIDEVFRARWRVGGWQFLVSIMGRPHLSWVEWQNESYIEVGVQAREVATG